jgi:Ca2+:H+ antiporter
VPRWVYALTAFGALAVIGQAVGAPPLAVFGAACIGLIPLAGLIGHATGQLASRVGPQWGGLLNATFGNAAELIITILALHEGLFTLVKASITGSIVGNTLLVLGLALLVGGVRNGLLKFDLRMTGLSSSLMILAVAGLLLPALFSTLVPDELRLEELSVMVALILLLSYAAYLVFLLRGNIIESADEEREEASWSVRRGLAALLGATAATAVVSEVLVNAVTPVTEQLGWTQLFLGVIIVPIVGNAAENWAAVRAAWRNRLDLSFSITSGSSTQIPLFVMPVLILVSLVIAEPMNLVFEPLELLVLGLSTAISAYIALDGESNWLEGVLLLALYLMTATVFFLDPAAASA